MGSRIQGWWHGPCILALFRAAANREPLGKSHEAAGLSPLVGGIEPGDGIELGDGIETHVRRTRPSRFRVAMANRPANTERLQSNTL